MSQHWGWKAKCVFVYVAACMACLLWLYIYVSMRVCVRMCASFLIVYSESSLLCSQQGWKLLWIWQLNDSSTEELEENCLVKVFTEMTSNAWLLTAATKTPIPTHTQKQRKQRTMVLTTPTGIFQLCPLPLISFQVLHTHVQIFNLPACESACYLSVFHIFMCKSVHVHLCVWMEEIHNRSTHTHTPQNIYLCP